MSRRRPRGGGWRPLDEDRNRAPRPLYESLDRISRSMGAPDAAALRAVFSGWETIAGAAVAAHSRPVAVMRKTLVVAVDEPGWATSVRALSAQLLRRVHAVAGPEIADRIEVRVTPRHQRRRPPPVVD